jgi:hypothetical protein
MLGLGVSQCCVNPHPFGAEPDPDPARHFDADPDPAFQFDAHLDPDV